MTQIADIDVIPPVDALESHVASIREAALASDNEEQLKILI